MKAEDDDLPQLSASTFAALQEFYQEQEEKEKLNLVSEDDNNGVISENWQLSQFWYDDETIKSLVRIAVETIGNNGKVALVSCPTLFKPLKNQLQKTGEVTLFEYDRRFSQCCGDDYHYYDYNSPLNIPREKSSYYDLVIADPPFLSEECLTKTAVTIKFLTKAKIILCTGATMVDLALRLLDLKVTDFKPKHRNNLANEFLCYSNFFIKNN